MTDPRNIAHDKKVTQEKKHHGEDIAKGTSETPQPGKKPHMQEHVKDSLSEPAADGESTKAGEDK